MEGNSTDTEEGNEDEEEEETSAAGETEGKKHRKDRPSVIVPTIHIQEERLVDLAETPAFRCLNEVWFFVYCYWSKT